MGAVPHHGNIGTPQAWLKTIGHARGPLPRDWVAAGRTGSLGRTAFPRRPRVEPGDHFVYYAAVWQRIFALVEVTSPPEHDGTAGRWPWSVAVEPLIVIDDLGDAPPVQACGVAPRSLSQHSHIRLPPDRYELAVAALAPEKGEGASAPLSR